MIKILKTFALFLLVLVLIGVLFGMFFIYKGIKSGDLKSYLTKTAIETAIPKDKLTPEQVDMLESGDFEGLINDVGENVTPEQIDCATEVLGEDRAKELLNTQDPTPQELLKLSKCL